MSENVKRKISDRSQTEISHGGNTKETWINPFVNKHRVVDKLRFGADRILRAARKFDLFVLRVLKVRLACVIHPWRTHCGSTTPAIR
jgi:hypothetical protein